MKLNVVLVVCLVLAGVVSGRNFATEEVRDGSDVAERGNERLMALVPLSGGFDPQRMQMRPMDRLVLPF